MNPVHTPGRVPDPVRIARDPRETERRTLKELGWTELLAKLAQRCHSERAKQAVADLPLHKEAPAIEALLDQVSEARELHGSGDPLPFGEVFELRPVLARLDKEGVLSGPTLLQVAETLRSLARLARFLRDHRGRAPSLAAIADDIDDLESIWGAIDDCFEPDGELADHASRELGDLRKRTADLKQKLIREMKRLMDSPRIARYLQDSFYTQRENRFVLPVRADAGGAVEGSVLGSSASGATLFVEPREVVGLNNQLKVAELAVHREEARILGELSQLVAEETEAIGENLAVGCELDLLDARARLAVDLDAVRPRLAEDGQLYLRAARHPLLVLAGVDVVPNELELGAGQALLISGPNAGGKTVALKTAGLCALMVRAGMLLPVGFDSIIPIYTRVLAEIGDAQSLEQNLSTFTAHLAQLLGFLELADAQSLVLIDEIATGTDPGQGEALAQALLEELVARGAMLIATTHYEGLKALPTHDARFVNANVGFDLARMQPTFALHIGAPGTSFALAVARKLGLDETVAQRAESLLADAENELSKLLVQLAGQRTELAQAIEAAESDKRAAEAEKRRYERKLAELTDKAQRALTIAHAAGIEELKSARMELARARGILRKERRDQSQLHQIDRQLDAASRKLAAHEPLRPAPEARPPAEEELVPGQRVFVRRLGGTAEIINPPRRGRVEVLFGGMHTLISIDEIELPTAGAAGKGKGTGGDAQSKQSKQSKTALPPGAKHVMTDERSIDNTLDLRGQRVEDALREADTFIDQALLEGRDVVYILHGRGSGALRQAIGEHLRRSPVVARSRLAEPDAGGDAITIVDLR